MIIDSLYNASTYTNLHPLFAKAFDFIHQNDFATIENDLIEIEEGLKVIVNTAQGKTREQSYANFECHNQHIDIQVCLQGTETMGWKPREKCTQPKGDYNSEKDVLFFKDAPDMDFQLTAGQFVIFFPEDVHAPMIGEGMIKKLVFKIKI
jgi:YhcH/YjgK/YiaL family protein